VFAAAAVIAATSLVMGATARGDTPTAGVSPASAAPGVPYWQATAMPTTVIQGGPIPPGWQPQAMAYQGIGPDGRPMTMYFAPTYVFTYQSGPPVPGMPPVGRPQVWGAPPAADGGWNYRTSGAQPVPVTLPPPPRSQPPL